MARDFNTQGRHEPNVPSNTITYFLKEAVRRTWTSKRTSFVAIAMIAISLFVLGCFLLLSENLQRAVERWQGHSRVTVYLNSEITPDEQRGVDAFLASHKELALARFRSYFTNLAEVAGNLEENPFPPSYEIELQPGIAQSAGFEALMT